MSDSYIGLDQQYDLYLEVIPANLWCQINTDLAGLSIESLEDIEPAEESSELNDDVSQKWWLSIVWDLGNLWLSHKWLVSNLVCDKHPVMLRNRNAITSFLSIESAAYKVFYS